MALFSLYLLLVSNHVQQLEHQENALTFIRYFVCTQKSFVNTLAKYFGSVNMVRHSKDFYNILRPNCFQQYL